jgi:hypothetical protein
VHCGEDVASNILSIVHPPKMAGELWKVSQEPIHKHFLPKFHPEVKILAMEGKETISISQ